MTIWALGFRNQLRAFFFLRSDLIIELSNLLAVGREQVLDDVNAALLNTHARELAGGQIDLKLLCLSAGNFTLDGFAQFKRLDFLCILRVLNSCRRRLILNRMMDAGVQLRSLS